MQSLVGVGPFMSKLGEGVSAGFKKFANLGSVVAYHSRVSKMGTICIPLGEQILIWGINISYLG